MPEGKEINFLPSSQWKGNRPNPLPPTSVIFLSFFLSFQVQGCKAAGEFWGSRSLENSIDWKEIESPQPSVLRSEGSLGKMGSVCPALA